MYSNIMFMIITRYVMYCIVIHVFVIVYSIIMLLKALYTISIEIYVYSQSKEIKILQIIITDYCTCILNSDEKHSLEWLPLNQSLKKKICCGWGFFFVRNWYQIEQSCNTNVSDIFPNNIPSFNFLSKGEAYVETTFCDAHVYHVHVVVRAV